MVFKLKDYLNTLNRECHQWYGWSVLEGDNERYENILVNDAKAIKPTAQECIDGVAKLQSDWDAKQYQRDRQYPPIGDQLDEIYHKGIDEWKKTIKAVKDAHPKP
jgi:hypothetical protein|tara:strand:- start:40 stop:354 length:315 start_codon:yes stop_codon:yes gene_type:complete